MTRISMLIIAVVMFAGEATFAQREGRSRNRDRERGTSSYTIPSHSDSGDFSQDYSIFDDLNIFVKDRHVKRAASTDTRPPRTPEQTYVLTGIVQGDSGDYHANFENLNGGSLVKVSLGNPLARGKITEIQRDQVAYEAAGKKTWVQIGNNLTGEDGNMSSDASSANSGPAVDPNTPGLSIEERLRARRMQQLNGSGAGGSAAPPSSSVSSAVSPAPRGDGDVSSGPPQRLNFNNRASFRSGAGGSGGNANGVVAAGSAAAQNGSGTANDAESQAAAADPSEPVITHNFPPLPGDAPGPPPTGQ